MSYKHHWASPAITTGWQNYANGWVYSPGIGMPTARLDFYGARPIRVHSFGDYYVTGPGSFMRMNYGGSIVNAGGVAVFGGSGGSFQWEAHQGNQTSSRMYFGRDPGCCSTISINDGFVWAGLLAGSFYWDQVPTAPGVSVSAVGRDLTVTVTAPGDNGGTGVDQYSVQISKDGGPWENQRNGGTTTYVGLAPGSYRARAWCHNAVGYSQTAISASVAVRAGGKRWTGTAFVSTQIARRWTGTAFVDLTIRKRWTGSAWVDIT